MILFFFFKEFLKEIFERCPCRQNYFCHPKISSEIHQSSKTPVNKMIGFKKLRKFNVKIFISVFQRVVAQGNSKQPGAEKKVATSPPAKVKTESFNSAFFAHILIVLLSHFGGVSDVHWGLT